MHRPYVDHQTDFDTLYRAYWDRIVRFCAKCLASLPDGTAEEVAQDVFLAAYNAIAQQRFRGESPFSTWLFGIARNLCSKVRRDVYRKTTADTIRRLECEVARLERAVVHLKGQPSLLTRQQGQHLRTRLTLACTWLDRERAPPGTAYSLRPRCPSDTERRATPGLGPPGRDARQLTAFGATGSPGLYLALHPCGQRDPRT
jgi:RNA polymerase sigma factor (sigma-70 family)